MFCGVGSISNPTPFTCFTIDPVLFLLLSSFDDHIRSLPFRTIRYPQLIWGVHRAFWGRLLGDIAVVLGRTLSGRGYIPPTCHLLTQRLNASMKTECLSGVSRIVTFSVRFCCSLYQNRGHDCQRRNFPIRVGVSESLETSIITDSADAPTHPSVSLHFLLCD